MAICHIHSPGAEIPISSHATLLVSLPGLIRLTRPQNNPSHHPGESPTTSSPQTRRLLGYGQRGRRHHQTQEAAWKWLLRLLDHRR